jgi:hypothetical protein
LYAVVPLPPVEEKLPVSVVPLITRPEIVTGRGPGAMSSGWPGCGVKVLSFASILASIAEAIASDEVLETRCQFFFSWKPVGKPGAGNPGNPVSVLIFLALA